MSVCSENELKVVPKPLQIEELEGLLAEGVVDSYEAARGLVEYTSRDNARTPMQWSDAEHAGFTDGEPWIGVNPNYETVNVEAERADPDSVWHYYRDLIALRGEEDVLVYGEYDLLSPAHDEIWAYTRTLGEETVLVVLNFSSGTPRFEPPTNLEGRDAELIVANYEVGAERVEPYALRPWEARVYHLG